MELIDENGNLFGVVNVIDALAVVLLFAVIVAGIVVVTGLSGGEEETRYATIELGQQPDHVIDRLEEGDVATFGSGDDVTVTDVYVTPVATNGEDNGSVPHVTIRAEVNGELHENDDGANEFRVGGEAVRPGSELELDTGAYVVSGTVTDLGREDPSLPVTETPIFLETTISDTTAAEMNDGDTVEIGPHTVATVTSLQLYPVEGDQQRALVGIDLVTLEQGSSPTFGGEAITIDRQLLLRTGNYDLSGTVIRRGNESMAGETNTTTVEIEVRNVSSAVADSLEAGMSETVRNETFATIESVEREPAAVVLVSQDGNIYEREHPRNMDVTLLVEFRVQETETGVYFRGEQLAIGRTITLGFDGVTVSGEVTRIG